MDSRTHLEIADAVFIKNSEVNKESKITLICSKTKIAPLKRLTISRLKLSAAHILAKLMKYVQGTMELSHVSVFLCTDSPVTLIWLSGLCNP